MEALALLCTLHADGPATLKRLRGVGCRSLADVHTFESTELAELLELTPAAARRFGKEARLLGDRVTIDLPDREEAPQLVTRGGAGPVAESAGGLGRTERSILDHVLERWSAEEAAEIEADARDESSEAFRRLADDEPAEVVDEEPELLAIEPGCVDGLDEARSLALAEIGI